MPTRQAQQRFNLVFKVRWRSCVHVMTMHKPVGNLGIILGLRCIALNEHLMTHPASSAYKAGTGINPSRDLPAPLGPASRWKTGGSVTWQVFGFLPPPRVRAAPANHWLQPPTPDCSGLRQCAFFQPLAPPLRSLQSPPAPPAPSGRNARPRGQAWPSIRSGLATQGLRGLARLLHQACGEFDGTKLLGGLMTNLLCVAYAPILLPPAMNDASVHCRRAASRIPAWC